MSVTTLLSFFFIYGFLGWCTEVGYAGVKQAKFVNRGFLNGPICPIYGVGICIVITLLTPFKSSVILLYITSTILVTLLEGVTGFAMDKIFHNKWWDYSNQPLNIGGYVCLIFSLVWGVACVVVVDLIHPIIEMLVSHIPFVVLVIFLVILSCALIADLYVTASAIFKLNKRLESMDKIAKELHELSDQLGEGIFNQVVGAMEKSEETREKYGEKYDETKERLMEASAEFKEKTQGMSEGVSSRLAGLKEVPEGVSSRLAGLKDVPEEITSRISGLKDSYQELSNKGSRVSKRLVKAFPKMESRKNNEQLEKLKEKLAGLKR